MTIQSALFDVVHSYFAEISKIVFILETAFPDRFRALVLGCLHIGTYIGVVEEAFRSFMPPHTDGAPRLWRGIMLARRKIHRRW